ncbi:aminotransferase class I/II-fold pyridoxal phosphate-dependent enzyme [Gulosibacter molinativorax]|nr:aminotransferase class I/II-fold pyridoxal phosphate-dependent enzyme [Gulosibacter molinativorax]
MQIPGHGMTPEGLAANLADFVGAEALSCDLTRVLDGVDLGPHSPEVEAQKLAARAWGARRTWFLTNGASQANRMATLAVRGLGTRILAQRNAHSSLSDGIILAGLEPRFMLPSIDHEHGISHGVHPVTLANALKEAEEQGAPVHSIYLVSPSYFGTVADIRQLADIAHDHGVPLIVDCAWGAHFGFHPDLPETPTRLGADLMVTSNHKLGGSLSQSAMLHLGEGEFADVLEPLVDRAFSMTASTSPSSLLLGSLDISRHSLETGTEQIGRSIDSARRLREAIEHDPRFSLLDSGYSQFADIVALDPLHVVIDISCTGQDGNWVKSHMNDVHGIGFEMATDNTVVAILGAGQVIDHDLILAALNETADAGTTEAAASGRRVEALPLPVPGTLKMLPRDAYFADTEVVSWQDSIGRIAASALAAYPPGVPNMLPGELITTEVIDYLRAVAATPDGYVRGAPDPLVDTVRVITGG